MADDFLSLVVGGWYAYRLVIIGSLVVYALYVRFARQKSEVKETPQISVKRQTTLPTKNLGQPVGSASKNEEKPLPFEQPKSQRRYSPKRVIGTKRKSRDPKAVVPSTTDAEPVVIQPVVFYFSLTGTTETQAKFAASSLDTFAASHDGRILGSKVLDLSYIDLDDYFVSVPKSDSPNVRNLYLILLPTYNIDTLVNNFINTLKETHFDFRIDTAPLINLAGYSVFGFGDKEGWPSEAEGFCSQAREVDQWMARLTKRKRAFPLGMGDIKSDVDERMKEWLEGVQDVLLTLIEGNGLGEGVDGSGAALESEDEAEEDDLIESNASAVTRRIQKKGETSTSLGDLEDLGGKGSSPLAIDFTTTGSKQGLAEPVLQEMVPKSSPTYAALTKQGYTILGSHSGVKICRWTKSALRGRGSCYKRSFYGIASHLCMETTPALSCSNKCVFCWRHGTNPVGTTWRWKVDPPELIFEGAKEAHLKKIKMMRGVPGVRAERFQEAQRIRHCALSLVGEPIFYPHINEFVDLLHKERISSFLVCNAQHPDQLAVMKKVTQLYVSIDASNKDSLKKIDRPLHRDFWERFQRCLDIIRERRNEMRTVFRLTLVKGFNIDDEVEGYADLVAKGLPCFVEIKGVTYCGTSTSASAGLTMQNVPFYEEVTAFVLALNAALAKRGLEYGIAAEHAHSCCVLLASNSFNVNGKWHTLIDYERFFDLLESGQEFGPEDYMGEETPVWANWGNGGFDPLDERVDRKGNKIVAPVKKQEAILA